MNKSDAEENWSYKRHKTHEAGMADESSLPLCYSAPDRVDAWRHRRMHKICEPLITHFPNAKWMTVGDGRFGSDAHFLKTQGLDVLATSLTDESLKKARDRGYIDNFAAMNAEHIELPDGSMDFVYCKEAYHHFPKPPVAFYEMFRVASKGVILIEPNEQALRPLGFIKGIAKRKLWNQPLHFEPCGNFIYRTHPKAITKLMSANGNEGAIAYKLFNDFYHPRLAQSPATSKSLGFFLQCAILGMMNFLCHIRLMDYALIGLIALKQKPELEFRAELKRQGFNVVDLPENPYTK